MARVAHRSGEPLLARPWLTLAAVALVTLIYYVVPLGADRSLPFRLVGLGVLLAGISVLTVKQLRRQDDPVGRLLLMLIIVVMGFAAVFFGLAQVPGQFDGLHTRTDALYFTVITMATIGYGDIHPVGQAARALVIGAVAFNLLFVAALGSTLVGRLRAGRTGTPATSTDATPGED